MNSGYYTRLNPRIFVLRGFTGQESLSLSESLPIDSSVCSASTGLTSGGAIGIQSGQIITVSPTTGNWVLGISTQKAGYNPFIAMEDSTDSDVISSGKLHGLSCSGNYEVQTAFFNTGDTWTNRNVAITWDSTAGNIHAAAVGGSSAYSTDSFIQTPNVDILGYTTIGQVDLNVGGPGNMLNPLTNTYQLAGLIANAGIDSQAAPSATGHIYVVQWVTRWLPARQVTANVS